MGRELQPTVSPDKKLPRKIDVPSVATPNLAFSEDGKTLYSMAVDDKAGAPYPGKVYALGPDKNERTTGELRPLLRSPPFWLVR